MSLPFGNISLFNKFHSIDGFPGPVNNKLTNTASNNKSKSHPLAKPFDSLAVNVVYTFRLIVVRLVVVSNRNEVFCISHLLNKTTSISVFES